MGEGRGEGQKRKLKIVRAVGISKLRTPLTTTRVVIGLKLGEEGGGVLESKDWQAVRPNGGRAEAGGMEGGTGKGSERWGGEESGGTRLIIFINH